MKKKRIYLHAGSITFATLFALTPLLAIFLMFLSYLGLSETIIIGFKEFLLQNLFATSATHTIPTHISNFIINIQSLNPTLIFFWIISCILLLYSIEDSINEMFDVNRRRSVKISLLLHLLLMIIIPIALIASFTANQQIAMLATQLYCPLNQSTSLCQLIHLLPITTDFILCLIIYGVLPLKKQKLRYIVLTSILVSILLFLAKILVGFYFSHSNLYTEVYGAVSSIPIFMTMIYVIWYIILLGASFCHQLSQS